MIGKLIVRRSRVTVWLRGLQDLVHAGVRSCSSVPRYSLRALWCDSDICGERHEDGKIV